MSGHVPIESALPWMGHWWREQADTPPTIVVRCHCGKKVGEVKRSESGHPRGGTVALMLAIEDVGEQTIDVGELVALTPEQLLEDIEELERDTLRHTDDGRRVMKRQRLAYAVGPIDGVPLMCPSHGYLADYVEPLTAMTHDEVPPE